MSVLQAIARPGHDLHQAATTFLNNAAGRALTISRATYMEALCSWSKQQVKAVLQRYGIAFDATVGLEQIVPMARRLQRAFVGTNRVLEDTDAMQIAGAVLGERTWVTADITAYYRAVDLGVSAQYVGSAEKMANAARYVREAVTY